MMTIQMMTTVTMLMMTRIPPWRQSLSEVQLEGSPLVKFVLLVLPEQDDHVYDGDGAVDDQDDADNGEPELRVRNILNTISYNIKFFEIVKSNISFGRIKRV